MSTHCSFLVPGDLGTRTGGYIYDRRIVDGLRAEGWKVDVVSLGERWPTPGAEALALARRRVEALPDDTLAVVDGLAFGAMPDLAAEHAQRIRWIALVHHPLALETGLSDEMRRAVFESERKALAMARGVIVTSPSTGRALEVYGVSSPRIAVVEPGTDPAAMATGSGSGSEAWNLLCVATVTPRKGHRLLIEALAGLMDRRWSLNCVGSLTMDPECATALSSAIQNHGMGERVILHGEKDENGLNALYESADVFVLPSFHEGYGMALAEALARGLPVISSRAGAIPDTVPSEAGVLIPPGDGGELREALRRLMDDADWRAGLAEGARAAGRLLPSWRQSAVRFAAALARFQSAAHE